MPLFTFLIQNGKTPLEEIEQDCPSLDEAHAEALRVLANSASDFTTDFWLHPVWTLRVLDELGTEIVMLNLSGGISK